MYYPAGDGPGNGLKGNGATLTGGRPIVQYIKKYPRKNNLGRPRKIGAPKPKPVVASAESVAAVADKLPAKRRRQPKFDAAYHQSPLSKKQKVGSIESLFAENQPVDQVSISTGKVELPGEQKVASVVCNDEQSIPTTSKIPAGDSCSSNENFPNRISIETNEKHSQNVACVKKLLQLGISQVTLRTVFYFFIMTF